ncbi:MAG: fibronectin type III domain-containing protein [Candidatus Dormibacteria bacterium]
MKPRLKRTLSRAGVLVAVFAATGALTVGAPSGLATTAPGFGYGTPSLVNYAAPSSLANSSNAGEPSIGVNWNTGSAMYQANSSTYRVNFDDATTPAAATWADTAAPNVVNIDPILATDHTTGRTFGGGLATSCSQLAYSDDDGGSWTPSNPCTGTIDHETIGSGPWAGAAPLGSSYSHAVYYCAQASVDACVTSGNGGLTFGAPTPVTGVCGGLHGHVKVSADGTAYVPDNNCGSATGGFQTRDNGASWSSYTIAQAASPGRGFDPSVTTTPDNTLYQAWGRAGDFHPTVARSTDHGLNWDRVTDLAGTVSPALVAATFPAMVSGDNGRLAVAFLGTSVGTAGVTPFDNGYHGVWYLYVSYSFDGGQTWSTVNATPNDPVQRGCLWDGGGSNSCRNLLDFMDASVTKTGRVVVGYADGCIGACSGTGGTEAESTSAYATIARQSTGQGLFAAYDVAASSPSPSASASPSPTPSASASPSPSPSPIASPSASPSPAAVPSAPQNLVAGTATKKGVTLTWQAPASSGSSALTGYDLYRATSCNGSETLYKSLGTGTTYTDTGTRSGVTYCYYLTAVNATGQGPASNQASATAR